MGTGARTSFLRELDLGMRLIALCLTACLLTTGPVLAHPGHGITEGDSAVHYLLEPVHAAPVILLLIGGIGLGLWRKRRNDRLKREYARKH